MKIEYKKWIVMGFLLGLIIVMVPIYVYFVFLDEKPHASSDKYTTVEIFEKYPTPKQLNDALINNEIDYHDLPITVQRLIDLYREKNN